MKIRKTREMGGILLVSGTTIGAGMLALPVLTGLAGFWPSALLFIFYWAMSLFTALLMLEVNLWFKHSVNLVTMSRYTLGKVGELVSWIVYLLLLYSLTAAYLAGSGPMVSDFIEFTTGIVLPSWAQTVPFLLIFGSFIYFGTRSVDLINRGLMALLVMTYFLLTGSSLSAIRPQLLMNMDPSYLWAAIPVVVTSFGFHIIIPSLTTYLHRNVKSLRRVIIIGSIIPLIVYLIWEFVILGIVPVEDLKIALQMGIGATKPLSLILNNPIIGSIAGIFSFCAIVTSFLGVGLSLSHFLEDGFKIKKTRQGTALSALLTFGIPLIFVLFYPQGFILALEYAGIFVAILLGILPILMVMRGRKIHKEEAPYTVWGGKPLLVGAFFAFLLVFVILFKELL